MTPTQFSKDHELKSLESPLFENATTQVSSFLVRGFLQDYVTFRYDIELDNNPNLNSNPV